MPWQGTLGPVGLVVGRRMRIDSLILKYSKMVWHVTFGNFVEIGIPDWGV